jgi:dephospho-CoA kinase
MIVVGVTGGIGSGKTTVCREWEKMGAYVFYADEEAKKLMVNSNEVVSQIKKTFGESSYNADGSLNKPHLIREAFEAGRVQELNDIVHPAVEKAFKARCKKAKTKGYKIAVKEAALLLNDGRPKNMDKIVIVHGAEHIRVKRVMERDQTTAHKIRERIAHQPDFETKLNLADFVIHNDGTLPELKKEAERVFQLLMNEQSSLDDKQL